MLLQLRQQARFGVVAGFKKISQERLQGSNPLAGRLVFGQRVQMMVHGLHPLRQAAQQLRAQPAHLGQRLDTLPSQALAGGIAHEQTPQTKGPGVLIHAARLRHAPALTVRGVQAPAHTGAGQPVLQHAHIGGLQTKTLLHGGHFKQTQTVGQTDARGGQAQQAFQGLDQRHFARGSVGYRKRNVPRRARRKAAKHRLNMRGKLGHVGHHHHHVARLQVRLCVQPSQDLIVQNLHFALRAVRAHQGDRAVICRLGLRLGGQGLQVQNIGLQLLQLVKLLAPRGLGGFKYFYLLQHLGIAFGLVITIEQVQIIAPLLAPRRQQGMGLGMQIGRIAGQRGHRHTGFAFLPRACMQAGAPIDHMAPVMTTGVLHHHQDLREFAQRRQGFDRLHGQGRNAKHHHAVRQAWGPRRRGQGLERLHELGMHRRTRSLGLGRTHIGLQCAPQMRLPDLVFRQGLGGPGRGLQHIAALRPIAEPIGAVALVAVQHIGHLLRQLVQLAAIAVAGQIACQWLVHGVLRSHVRQQAQQAPKQGRLVKRHVHRHGLRAQHAAVDLPQKGRRQLHAGGGANAQSRLIGQRQLQPMLHAVALHQKDFGLQRRQRPVFDKVHHQIAQVFQAVAMHHHEARLKRKRR